MTNPERAAKRFAFDFIAPAIGLIYLWNIVVEKQREKVWWWLLPFAIAILATNLPRSGFGEVNLFGVFLLLVVIPLSALGYCALWVKNSLASWAAEAGHRGDRIWRSRNLPLLLGIVVFPLGAVTLAAIFLIFGGPMWFDPWVQKVALVTMGALLSASLGSVLGFHRRNLLNRMTDVLSAVSPTIGVQGLAYFFRGERLKGAVLLGSGWTILGLGMLLLRISWIERYSWSFPDQLVNLAIYSLAVLYAFMWIYGSTAPLDGSQALPHSDPPQAISPADAAPEETSSTRAPSRNLLEPGAR